MFFVTKEYTANDTSMSKSDTYGKNLAWKHCVDITMESMKLISLNISQNFAKSYLSRFFQNQIFPIRTANSLKLSTTLNNVNESTQNDRFLSIRFSPPCLPDWPQMFPFFNALQIFTYKFTEGFHSMWKQAKKNYTKMNLCQKVLILSQLVYTKKIVLKI